MMKQYKARSGSQRLSDLLAAVKAARFDPGMLEDVVALGGQTVEASDPLPRLRRACVASEILDHYGRYREAETAVSPAVDDSTRLLSGAAEPSSETASLWKWHTRILVAAAWAAFHQGRYSASLSLLARGELGLRRLELAAVPTFGTRARLHYVSGHVHRQLNEFDKANEEFEHALTFTEQRVRGGSPDGEALRHATWTTARCLAFGLGWIAYKRGQLLTAESLVHAGGTLFSVVGNDVHKAYSQLLLCAIRRARVGRDEDQLKDLSSSLRRVHQFFERVGHASYQGRAALELALVELNLGNYSVANRHLTEYGRLASGGGCRHALLKAMVIKSRLLRLGGHLPEALDVAARANSGAALANERLIQVEALVSICEIETEASKIRDQSAPSRLDKAREAIEEAERLSSGNAKLSAVCFLQKARIMLLSGDNSGAQQELGRYGEIEPLVEAGLIRELASSIRADLRHQDLVIAVSGADNLDYAYWSRQLREYLLHRARNCDGGLTASAAAEKLGISRQTLYEWMRAEKSSKRMSAPRPGSGRSRGGSRSSVAR